MTERLITLHTEVLMGMTGTVDHTNFQINGVSIITSNVDAEGHDLSVDDTTVDQLFKLAKKMGKVPVLLDHGSGINSMNGYLHDFRLDDGKLRADWQLLESHDETSKMLERAEKMPECFGLSAAFKGKGVAVKGGKKAARAEKLLSVDCVTRPAANVGLFSAKDEEIVDTIEIDMANKPQKNEEPTIADLMAALGELKNEFGQRFAQLEQAGQPEYTDVDLLRDLYNASDEELAQWNEQNGQELTRAQIDGAVSDYNASIDAAPTDGDLEDTQSQPGDGHAMPEGSPAATAAPAGVSTAAGGPVTGAALAALQRELVELKSKFQRKEQIELEAKEEHELAEVNQKMILLATQRDKAFELAEKVVAKNEALEKFLHTGTRPARAAVNEKIFQAKFNGEVHEFQQKVRDRVDKDKCSVAKAIQLESAANPDLHQDWLHNQGTSEFTS